MGKRELADEIQRSIDEPEAVDADDLDTNPECANCGKEMPYEEYNETSPQDDFISHVIPGENEFTAPKTVLYCGISCFMQKMQQYE